MQNPLRSREHTHYLVARPEIEAERLLTETVANVLRMPVFEEIALADCDDRGLALNRDDGPDNKRVLAHLKNRLRAGFAGPQDEQHDCQATEQHENRLRSFALSCKWEGGIEALILFLQNTDRTITLQHGGPDLLKVSSVPCPGRDHDVVI